MHLRVNDLHRKRASQFSQRGCALAAHPCAHAKRRTFNPKTGDALPTGLAVDHETVGARTDEVIQSTGSERTAAAQDIDRLQQAGLARGVRSADEGESRIELQLRGMQASEIRYPY